MNLEQLRHDIDQVDNQILALFTQRMDIIKKVAALKESHNLPLRDPGREAEKLQVINEETRPDLAPYAQTLYEILFALSRRYQTSMQIDHSAEL